MTVTLFQFVVSGLIILAYFVLRWSSATLMARLGTLKQVPELRVKNINKYFNGLFVLVCSLALMMVWGLDYRGLLIFASSVLAVIGVALVAQWSILSNITAGVIVFFALPAKVGDKVIIVDGSNQIRGIITEINLFQILLRDDDNQLVAYPNNLILQRPVIKVDSNDLQKESLKEVKAEEGRGAVASSYPSVMRQGKRSTWRRRQADYEN